MRKAPTRLFHYCCGHSAADIRRDMTLRPARAVLDARGYHRVKTPPAGTVLWLTDMRPPVRDALGLTMFDIACDRLTHAFEVKPDWQQIEWWMTYRKRHPEMLELETVPGVLPMHWWVSEVPVTAVREL